MTDEQSTTDQPWVAYLADSSGFVYQSVEDAIEDLADDEEVRIGVARGSAAPMERDGGLRLPGTHRGGDRAYEFECYLDGEGVPAESAEVRYAQAQAMAAGLNAVADADRYRDAVHHMLALAPDEYRQTIVAARAAGSGSDYAKNNGRAESIRTFASGLAERAGLPAIDWEQIKRAVPSDGVYRTEVKA